MTPPDAATENRMRVIAGVARGVPLVAPRDRSTRPITDRVKETLFAILGERIIDARLLDLFAGSGAIGIEGLSRGARRATFVERGREALTALHRNLERTKLAAQAEVRDEDVLRFLDVANPDAWDLAILDPPYEQRAILAPLERLVRILPPGTPVVVKHFWRAPPPEMDGYLRWRERRFGETALTFLERSPRGGGGRA